MGQDLEIHFWIEFHDLIHKVELLTLIENLSRSSSKSNFDEKPIVYATYVWNVFLQ